MNSELSRRVGRSGDENVCGERGVWFHVALALPLIDPTGTLTGGTDLRRPRHEYHYDDQGRQTHTVSNAYLDESANQVVYLTKLLTTGGADVEDGPRRTVGGDPSSWPKDQGHVTSFVYDAEGRELSRTLPSGQVESKSYVTTPGESYGQLASATDFEGRVVEYAYDNSATGRGRLMSMTYKDAGGVVQRTVSYTYDALGRQVAVDDGGFEGLGVTSMVYDAEGRLTEHHTPQGDLYHAYDDLGRKTDTWSGTATSGTATTHTSYEYDQLGRLTKTTAERRFGVSEGCPIAAICLACAGCVINFGYPEHSRVTRPTTPSCRS